jgi:hypothetical protein
MPELDVALFYAEAGHALVLGTGAKFGRLIIDLVFHTSPVRKSFILRGEGHTPLT